MPAKRFLVDTSAWILALKPDGALEVRERIGQLLSDEILFTTGMINLELLGGAQNREGIHTPEKLSRCTRFH